MDGELNIIMPQGAAGRSNNDTVVDGILRDIALRASEDPAGEWAEKYGTRFENDVFLMHPFCWCDRVECPWCDGDCRLDNKEPIPEEWLQKGVEPNERLAPNFWHKPSNFKAWWYKYIGRSMETNRAATTDELLTILNDCINSLPQPEENAPESEPCA